MNTNPKIQFKIWAMTVHGHEQYPRHTKSPRWHRSVNDLDGVNEKELIENKLRKVGPN